MTNWQVKDITPEARLGRKLPESLRRQPLHIPIIPVIDRSFQQRDSVRNNATKCITRIFGFRSVMSEDAVEHYGFCATWVSPEFIASKELLAEPTSRPRRNWCAQFTIGLLLCTQI
jgi:hypothetical protein